MYSRFLVRDQEVEGSNPFAPTILLLHFHDGSCFLTLVCCSSTFLLCPPSLSTAVNTASSGRRHTLDPTGTQRLTAKIRIVCMYRRSLLAEPFRYAPGQFNMLYVFGIGEVPISISGGNGALIRHTTRAVGTVTKAMRELKRGAVVGLRGPYGSQWPLKEATGRDVVIAAGGIGLAPLRSALHHIIAHRGDYGRVTLLYGARTPEDILYRHELEQWRGKFDLDVYVTVDRAASTWRGMVGVVTKLVKNAAFDPARALAMICRRPHHTARSPNMQRAVSRLARKIWPWRPSVTGPSMWRAWRWAVATRTR
jgi:NAD(P)H-flavin reductase